MSQNPNDPNGPNGPQYPRDPASQDPGRPAYPGRPTPPEQPPSNPYGSGDQAGPVSGGAHPGGHQPPRGYGPTVNTVEAKGFFGALFDFSFTSFVTIKFAKIIYIILIALVVLGWLSYVVTGFAFDPGLGLAALLLGWIPGFIALVLVRVMIEFYIAMVRTSQNTAATVAEIQALRQDNARR